MLSLLLLIMLSTLAVKADAADLSLSPPLPLPGVTQVEGHLAPFFHNQPISAFRVYAFDNNIPRPIPFQIDERDHRDRWILTHGPKAKQDTPANVFDANDVLLFMNRDLGERGDPLVIPAAAQVWAEVQIGNSHTPLGFVYVGLFTPAAAPALEEAPYARYDPPTDRIYAERYALAFNAPLPTHFAPVEQIGDFGTNTISGIKVAAEVRLLGGLLTFQRTHTDLHGELRSYQPGPVRVLRQAKYWIPLPFGLRTSGKVNLIFYRDFVEGSALIKMKIPLRLVLADGEFKTYFDFLNLSGARLLLNGLSLSDPVNGAMTEAKRALDGRSALWAALVLPTGRSMLLIPRLEGALSKLDQRSYFFESTTQTAGGLPHFGFQFLEINRLETGSHRLSVFGVLLDSTAPDDIQQAAQLFLSPPPVKVMPVMEVP